MKNLLTCYLVAFTLSISYAQSYTDLISNMNFFLKNFDNNWYGKLEIKDDILYDYYKDGTYSRININNILEAKEVEANRKVEIICKSGNCVNTNTRGDFDNMPFSTNVDFDATGFAANLNALVAAYKSDYAKETTELVGEKSPFTVGTKVKLIVYDKKISTYESTYADDDAYIVGIVSADDLVSVGNGCYSGRIKLENGTVKVFEKAQFKILQ